MIPDSGRLTDLKVNSFFPSSRLKQAVELNGPCLLWLDFEMHAIGMPWLE